MSMPPGLRVYIESGLCVGCGTRIEVYGTRRYCSRRCKQADAARRRRAAARANAACDLCGRPAAMIKRGRGGGPRCTNHHHTMHHERKPS